MKSRRNPSCKPSWYLLTEPLHANEEYFNEDIARLDERELRRELSQLRFQSVFGPLTLWEGERMSRLAAALELHTLRASA